MTYEALIVEREGAVTVVTFNRPKVLNALNAVTMRELREVMLACQADPDVRAVVLTGAGEKAFVAGADINELAVLSPVEGKEHAAAGQRVFDLIEGLGKPVIAAVNGFALGGGCELAMMCDLPPGPVPEHLELMISGGSAFTPALYRRMRTRWPHVSLANWYGLMESGCGQTLNYGPDMEAEPGAIGRPVPPTKVRIVDDEFADVAVGVEGELWTQATAQMREYFRNPEQTAKRLHDGWLRTGDRALIDGDGILHVVGRNEERINRGGFKFYPIEIEAVLEADPQVREVAVITVPHETLGQDVVAFVVPADGAEIDPDALRARCKMRVAPNKVPSQIFIKDALPRTAYGKVVRRSLAGEYEQMKAAR